jgi:Domain of unknown function (DUF6946)
MLARYPSEVPDSENTTSNREQVGLCSDCQHTLRITSSRGSTFYLCGRSAHDPKFPKYPRLPVIQCPGYDPKILRIHKARHDIRSVDDWFKYAPPKMGSRHWKDGRSAKELAKSWFRKGFACPPEEMRLLLEEAFQTAMEFDEARPECIIELDDFRGEHRNCDLVVLCRAGMKHITINIEAKADEPLGDSTVGAYYDQKLNSSSNVPKRIESLSAALFGKKPDALIRSLRYQLVHSAAATLIEADVSKAEVAVFLVQEFYSASLSSVKLQQNRTDWTTFVRAFPELTHVEVGKNQIVGPISVPGGGRVPNSIPLYLGNITSIVLS